MTNAKSAPTPLPAGWTPKANTGQATPKLRTEYQSIIGSLLYLMIGTRPDIAFSVTALAQFSANPSEEHLKQARYICRYLVGTKDYHLVYKGNSDQGLCAFTDSDWASNPINRKSITGYFMKLADCPIIWRSRAQTTIALSSTEAEYMAMSDCSRQVSWIISMFNELGMPLPAIPVYGDNQGSIFIGSNPVQENRSKHIDIRYHYLRECVAKKKIELFFIPSEDNPADLLTKNLGHIKFHKFRARFGLVVKHSTKANVA
jgi:hypothetical protein